MNRAFQSIPFFGNLRIQRGMFFGILIIVALLSFEMFNYSTTDYSLADLLGNLRFLGIRWATILAIAFCGIDFAGLARMFTPEQGADEPNEVWYLFGAWLLAATMNAFLTWWGVSVAILSHAPSENSILQRETVLRVVPVFVAIMVWLIRVLIIGTFSVAGDRLFSQSARRSSSRFHPAPASAARQTTYRPTPLPNQSAAFQPAPRPVSAQGQQSFARPEPTYHPMAASGGYHKDDLGGA